MINRKKVTIDIDDNLTWEGELIYDYKSFDYSGKQFICHHPVRVKYTVPLHLEDGLSNEDTTKGLIEAVRQEIISALMSGNAIDIPGLKDKNQPTLKQLQALLMEKDAEIEGLREACVYLKYRSDRLMELMELQEGFDRAKFDLTVTASMARVGDEPV